MKIHRAWIRATAAALAVGTQAAVGQVAQQVAPYGVQPQYTNQYSNVAPYGVPQAQQPAAYPTVTYPATAQAAPQMQAPVAQQAAYPTTAMPTVTYPQTRLPQTRPPHAPAHVARAPQYSMPRPQPQYQPQYQAQQSVVRPGYPAIARMNNSGAAPQNGSAPVPPQGELLPTPADAGANGNAATSYDPSYAGGCNCNSYPAAGGYYGDTYGGPDYGIGGYMEGYDDGGSQWFGGVYGLYMTRTEPAYRRYTTGVDYVAVGASPATPYVPGPADVENYSDCSLLIPDWRYGYEVRLGCTFDFGNDCGDDYGYGSYGCDSGCNTGCDSCNSCDCCQPCQQYAWEVAFWSLDRDVQSQYVDGPLTPNFRYYGMVNYAGLEYDDGTNGLLPVNDYYNYQMPITGSGDFGPGSDQVVLAQRVRTNFWAQNLELNFLRLPLLSGCDPCGCGGSAFNLTGLCGVRWFRVDDDLEFGTEWGTFGDTPSGWDYSSPNELYHDIQMENNLVGFQLGANMSYTVAQRWTGFWDTNFGLYNNYVEQYQRMYNGVNGPVQFTQEGRNFVVRSDKNDVAFLGEMRLGGAYSVTEHCRGVLAYRGIAISGLALAPDQIKPEYGDWASVALINADGSIIIHGVQAGMEFCY